MEAKDIGLETLLQWLWADNPKLHQDVMIQHSMITHGFNDRVGVSSKFELVLEGHGRLGNLKQLKTKWLAGDPNAKLPVNIKVDPVNNDWLIPCDDHNHFDTKEQAYQYALMHNRSGVAALDLRDYNLGKLQKAIAAASAGQQMGFEMLGFGAADFATGNTSDGQPSKPEGMSTANTKTSDAPAIAQLPKTEVFDPSKLNDAPGYQANQAPQAFVAMITAPDAETFARILNVLTFGERKTLPEGARFASVEGGKFLLEWERLLVREAVELPKAKRLPLKGQQTMAGDVVTDPNNLPTSLAGEALAVDADPNAPTWDADGNFVACDGKGYTGTRNIGGSTHKVYCTVCNAAGTKLVWDAQKVA